MKIGVHISISGGIEKSFSKAEKIGCDTFQIFTRNPRSWNFKILTNDIISKFKYNLKKYKIRPIYSHLPYLANLASPDLTILKKSISSLKNELNRCDLLGIPYVVTHLGSQKGETKENGMLNLKKALNGVLEKYNGKCKILLENTAGKNQKLGSNLADICAIINEIDYIDKVGLCLDTCHAFVSGYDIRRLEVIDKLLIEINSSIGLKKIFLVHCNDAKSELGSGIDRHEHIGLGKIGESGFRILLKDKRLKKVPFICETPVDDQRNDEGNLNYLRALLKK
ncbi:MAG: deoxyribonuclease IV [Asgard group archaeon]|nr:deoxyribonuclease IV [Asgard group archaeon]